MPSLSGAFNPALGPIITLLLTPPAVLHRQVMQAAQAGAQGQPINVHGGQALIDTGASITSVTGQLAAAAGLPLIGMRTVATAGGPVPANTYLADIGIPFGPVPQAAAGQTVQAQIGAVFTLQSITVLEFQGGSPHFNMLLGRDILCMGVFTLGFDGRFTFSI